MGAELRTSDGRTVVVDDSGGILGSDACADVRFPSKPGLLRKHARLQRVGSQWFLEALEGASFWVHGKQSKTCRVEPGLEVRLTEDGCSFVFVGPAIASLESEKASLHLGLASPTASLKSLKLVPRLLMASGGLLAIALLVAVLNYSGDRSPEPTSSPVELKAAENDKGPVVAIIPESADPRDALVLFGYRNPSQDLPPVTITVGWMLNGKTMVVPAEILRGFEAAYAAAEAARAPIKFCALSGAAIDAASWSFPLDCPDIAFVQLMTPLARVGETKQRLVDSGAERIAQLADRGSTVMHCSYESLPRSTQLHQPLVSLVSYTPGSSKQLILPATVRVELASNTHEGWLVSQPSQGQPTLERGGLIIDSEHNILAMCLPSGKLVWSDVIRQAANDLEP